MYIWCSIKMSRTNISQYPHSLDSVSRLTEQTQEPLSLALAMLLHVYGTPVLQVEQFGPFMAMREISIPSSFFQMEIDSEPVLMMDHVDYMTSELGTSSKYIISSMLIMIFLL